MTVSLGEGLFAPQVYTDPLLEPDPVPPRDRDEERHDEVLAALYAVQAALVALAQRPQDGPSPIPVPGPLVAPAPSVTVNLDPVVEALDRHDTKLTVFADKLTSLSKVVAASAGGFSSGGSSGNVIVDGGTLDSIRQPVVTATQDNRSLAERMLARAPAPGYSLYVDTADSAFIYVAEVSSANTDGDPQFRGIRVPKDAAGNPLGRVQTATGFAWTARASAAWT